MNTYKLSKAARAQYDAGPGFHLYRQPSVEHIANRAEVYLMEPDLPAWSDDALWNTHTLMFDYAPASGDIIAESNYRRILEDMQAEYSGEDRVASAGYSSWTYPHFDAIRIRVLDKRGHITPEFVRACEILQALEDYPIYDENDFHSLESEYWNKSFDQEWESVTRGAEVSDADQVLIADWIRNSSMYHSDYVDPDSIREAALALGIDLGED